MAKFTGVCTPQGEAEGAEQVQPGKEKTLGEANSSPPVPIPVRSFQEVVAKLT